MHKNNKAKFIIIAMILIMSILGINVTAVSMFSSYRSIAGLTPLYYFNTSAYIYWNNGNNWIQQNVYNENVEQAVIDWNVGSDIDISETQNYMSSNIDVKVIYDTTKPLNICGYTGFYQPTVSSVQFLVGNIDEDWTFSEVYLNHRGMENDDGYTFRCRVVAHEIGHTFGLDEATGNTTIMSYSYTGRGPTNNDIYSVQYYY